MATAFFSRVSELSLEFFPKLTICSVIDCTNLTHSASCLVVYRET